MTKSRPPRSSPESRSDRELLAKLRRADREAFDALYEAYFPRVYTYFRRRFETLTDAEGATEAALTTIFQNLSAGTAQVPLHDWIFRRVRAVKESGSGSPQRSKSVSVSSVLHSAARVRS